MRRRIARVVTVSLLAIGTIVVAWTAVSSAMDIAVYREFARGHFVASGGSAELWIRRDHDEKYPLFQRVNAGGVGYHVLQCPYFLLALLCLAWPVTSFIIARRRGKGRGFEVETKGASAAEAPMGGEQSHGNRG